MKQYFAKFISTNDDNIKDGDYYLFQGKIQRCKKSIISDLKALYGENWDNTLYQKVELFLCSRDTKNIKTHIDQQQWQEMSRQEKDEHLLETGQYRVIGKISSEANWVKEGDEFDENQLKKEIIIECYFPHREVQYETQVRSLNVLDSYIEKNNETLMCETILIKGCCNHYH